MQELLSQRFEAQRQKLVSMDIVAVAESLGMTLKSGSSGAYYWEEHDSFHIYPNTNTFRWWSRGVGTNTIDLVQVVQEELTGHKPSFREATSFLETGQFNNVTVQPPVKDPFEYYLERYEHSDFNIGRQYLKEERGLSDETIDTFLASGNLATATRKKGDYFEPVIVFKSRDNDGKMIGASLQGIVENRVQHPERGRLKQMMKNSEGTAGFSLDVGTPKRLVFAEAPIDLMSYYEVNKDDLQDVKLVAMGGLKKSVVSRYVADLLTDGKYSQTMSAEQIRGALDALNQTTNLLQEHSDMITLAVDNDEAGQNFVKGLQDDGIPVIPDLPPRQTAQKKMDWNDYLKQMKKESAQMAETPEVEKQSLSELQESLSNEGDLVSTITSDSSIIYTNTVSFNQDYNLNLEIHSPNEVDNLSDIQAPWTLEVMKKGQSLGYLAYGEDWGNDFDIEDELVNLDNWLARNQVENYLYSQEEVNSFLKPLTFDKEAVGELKSYGTFIIDDDFLERRYGSVEHDNSIRTAIEQLSNLIGFNNMPINDQETEWVHTKEVDFEGTQLILDVYSSSEDKIFEGKNKNNNWSIAVLGENGPLGFLTYGEAWLDDINDGTTLRDRLADLQTWITEGSISKHLYTQQDYNHFNASLKEKALSQSQEPNTGGELFNRSSSSLGDDSPGTAPKPVEYETQPSFPTNVPLHFNIDRNIKSNYRLHQGYSYPKNRDIRNMNAYAEGIQKSANWYLNELANSTVTYFYVDGEEPKALQVEFKKRHWMHLTGLSPIYLDRLDSVSETFIDEIASGKTTFSNVSVGTGFLDKIQVLPMLPEILETDSFVFDDLSSIEKFGRLDASAAIRSDDKNMVLAFQVDDKNEMFPASLMKPGKKLNLEMDTLSQEKTILGVIVDKEGSTKVHRVNENYIKDGGEEMKSIVENKQFEEVKVTKTDVTAKKQKAKDSDGDGLTDDEEIALGTNPYSPDTDGDGVIDSIERGSGTDATNPSDTLDNRQNEQMKHNLTLSEMIKAKDTTALNQHLQEGIKDYFDSDTYKNYLEGMAHFNHYSARNIQLIKAQLPEATMIASFEEWKKRNGHVNKGEKALYVQAPVTVIKKDVDGKPVINADTGEKETFTYFKPVPVFDISQISPQQGKQLNLPKSSEAIPAQLNKDYYQNVYRALRDISQKENGIPIRFRELEQSDGFYNPKTNDITIKKGMTYEQTLSTLIHEMAHSELHNNQSLAEHFKGKLTRSSEELQAESVAYVVSNHLGFDTSNDSFAYLASWSQEPDGLENLKAQLEIVQEEASSLMNRIDKQLTKYQTLTVSKDEPLTETQKRNLEKSVNPFYQSLQKAKAETNNMKKGDEPSNEKTAKKDNRPTKC